MSLSDEIRKHGDIASRAGQGPELYALADEVAELEVNALTPREAHAALRRTNSVAGIGARTKLRRIANRDKS